MYRLPLRKAPTTVIEYQAKDLQVSALVLAALFGALAIVLLAMLHTTTISCRRASEYATARCTIHRSGVRPLDAELRAEAISRFDVRVVENKKHRRSAEVRLELAPSFTPRVLALETGVFGGDLDVASTLTARERFLRFQSVPTETAYDATLSRPDVPKAALFLGGVVFLGIALRLVHEQLRQLRPVRVIVDHERSVVVIGGKAVPFAEVRDVMVEQGMVRSISNPKGSPPVGFKLSVVLTSFDRIYATREWRAGGADAHEDARRRVLEAMGRLEHPGTLPT